MLHAVLNAGPTMKMATDSSVAIGAVTRDAQTDRIDSVTGQFAVS